MNVCHNSLPLEAGPWTRRPCFRWLGHAYKGGAAILRAFDFTITQPYQMEFSNDALRFWSGTSLVTTTDAPRVANISTANPAVVYLTDAIPSGWVSGDQILFDLVATPCSSGALCNRQFQIANLNATDRTFELRSSLSGTGIDGSTIAYSAPSTPDVVRKILTLVTPYGASDLHAIRSVQDQADVLVLHQSYQPRTISAGTAPAPFAIAAQAFEDGPYLDINTTTTTLTLSATSGSGVTITASSIAGINNNTGFQTTDVGRHIRFQGGPPLWSASTAYAKSDQVTASDGNIYVALGGMTGLDPTLDDGTHWQISPAHVNWIWITITGRTSTTVVTGTIQSDLRAGGSFGAVQGNGNIRAYVGVDGSKSLLANYAEIDFTQSFSAGNVVTITNGAFTDGGGGDISATYTVKLVNNVPSKNYSFLVFTGDGGQTAAWSTVAGLTDNRTAPYSPDVAQILSADGLTTTVWRLGLYSDTTGWPSAGTYHDGRLWLTSKAYPNRVDSSKSNDYFNFAPTGDDGTVADDNGISAVFNAQEINAIFWLQTTVDGLKLGTQAGEWLVKASTLDDPLSPSNIQARRVTTFGCADVEPVEAWAKTLFVQRQNRLLIEHGLHPWLGKYQGDNKAMLADDLTDSGLAEVRWQQAPLSTLWLRRNDGTLVGMTYKNILLDETKSFTGWHDHVHGNSARIFESLSTGPAPDGLSDTLYAVTSDGTRRDIEMLAPLYDTAADECDAAFVDSSPALCCVTLTGGSPPTGIRLYGLTHLNGKTVQPFVGGLDLGDYAVANGYIDILFADSSKSHDAARFTWAYFQTLTAACDLYGADAALTSTTTVTPAHGAMSLMGLVGADTPVGYNAFGGSMLIDHANSVAYFRETGTTTGDAGLKALQTAVPGDELLQATETDIFGAGPAQVFTNASGCTVGGKIYANVSGSNSSPIAKIDGAALTLDELVGTDSSSLSASACDGTTGVLTRMTCSFQMVGLSRGSSRYVASRNIRSAGHENEVAVLNVTTTGSMKLLYAVNITEDVAGLCKGKESSGVSTFYALGQKFNYSTGSSTPSALYAYSIVADSIAPANVYANNEAVTRRTIRSSIVPTDIDATWSNFTAVSNPGYDQKDGNILAFFTSPSGPTNLNYLVKFAATDGSILWKLAVTAGETTQVDLPQCNINGTLQTFTTSKTVKTIDLSTGTVSSTVSWNAGFSSMSGQAFDYLTGSITANMSYSVSGTPVPAYLGDYLAANSNTIPTFRWGRIYTGATYTTTSTTTYPFYGVVGLTYTSQGQLLRPDFGQDAGTQAGPAFGKMRRVHKAALGLVRSFGIKIGTAFTKLKSVPLNTPGGTAYTAPTQFTGNIAAKNLEIGDTTGTDSQLAWQIDRPYPATVTAIAGFIESQDE